MKRTYSSNTEALAVAKEAVWLAWRACGGTTGCGFLQDRGPKQDREKVWDHAHNERDYPGGHRRDPGEINCDYVMGRMMKLRFEVMENVITYPDFAPRRDYQAWCGKFPTFDALFSAAALATRGEPRDADNVNLPHSGASERKE